MTTFEDWINSQPINSQPIKPQPGRPCPDCVNGHNADGSFVMGRSPDGSSIDRYNPGSLCATCGGSGRVKIVAIPRQELSEAGQ